MSEEYDRYLKDQVEDTMLEPQYLEMGKRWIYKYLDFLKMIHSKFDYAKANVLDVGCREFFTYDYFLEKFGTTIQGSDLCKAGLQYTNEQGKPVIEGDFHQFDTGKYNSLFDLVMSFHAFEHMYDLPKVIENCNKILKPGGYLYFAVPVPCQNTGRGHWYDIPSVEFMDQLCAKNGFEKVFSKLYGAGFFRDEDEMVGLYKKC